MKNIGFCAVIELELWPVTIIDGILTPYNYGYIHMGYTHLMVI